MAHDDREKEGGAPLDLILSALAAQKAIGFIGGFGPGDGSGKAFPGDPYNFWDMDMGWEGGGRIHISPEAGPGSATSVLKPGTYYHGVHGDATMPPLHNWPAGDDLPPGWEAEHLNLEGNPADWNLPGIEEAANFWPRDSGMAKDKTLPENNPDHPDNWNIGDPLGPDDVINTPDGLQLAQEGGFPQELLDYLESQAWQFDPAEWAKMTTVQKYLAVEGGVDGLTSGLDANDFLDPGPPPPFTADAGGPVATPLDWGHQPSPPFHNRLGEIFYPKGTHIPNYGGPTFVGDRPYGPWSWSHPKDWPDKYKDVLWQRSEASGNLPADENPIRWDHSGDELREYFIEPSASGTGPMSQTGNVHPAPASGLPDALPQSIEFQPLLPPDGPTNLLGGTGSWLANPSSISIVGQDQMGPRDIAMQLLGRQALESGGSGHPQSPFWEPLVAHYDQAMHGTTHGAGDLTEIDYPRTLTRDVAPNAQFIRDLQGNVDVLNSPGLEIDPALLHKISMQSRPGDQQALDEWQRQFMHGEGPRQPPEHLLGTFEPGDYRALYNESAPPSGARMGAYSDQIVQLDQLLTYYENEALPMDNRLAASREYLKGIHQLQKMAVDEMMFRTGNGENPFIVNHDIATRLGRHLPNQLNTNYINELFSGETGPTGNAIDVLTMGDFNPKDPNIPQKFLELAFQGGPGQPGHGGHPLPRPVFGEWLARHLGHADPNIYDHSSVEDAYNDRPRERYKSHGWLSQNRPGYETTGINPFQQGNTLGSPLSSGHRPFYAGLGSKKDWGTPDWMELDPMHPGTSHGPLLEAWKTMPEGGHGGLAGTASGIIGNIGQSHPAFLKNLAIKSNEPYLTPEFSQKAAKKLFGTLHSGPIIDPALLVDYFKEVANNRRAGKPEIMPEGFDVHAQNIAANRARQVADWIKGPFDNPWGSPAEYASSMFEEGAGAAWQSDRGGPPASQADVGRSPSNVGGKPSHGARPRIDTKNLLNTSVEGVTTRVQPRPLFDAPQTPMEGQAPGETTVKPDGTRVTRPKSQWGADAWLESGGQPRLDRWRGVAKGHGKMLGAFALAEMLHPHDPNAAALGKQPGEHWTNQDLADWRSEVAKLAGRNPGMDLMDNPHQDLVNKLAMFLPAGEVNEDGEYEPGLAENTAMKMIEAAQGGTDPLVRLDEASATRPASFFDVPIAGSIAQLFGGDHKAGENKPWGTQLKTDSTGYLPAHENEGILLPGKYGDVAEQLAGKSILDLGAISFGMGPGDTPLTMAGAHGMGLSGAFRSPAHQGEIESKMKEFSDDAARARGHEWGKADLRAKAASGFDRVLDAFGMEDPDLLNNWGAALGQDAVQMSDAAYQQGQIVAADAPRRDWDASILVPNLKYDTDNDGKLSKSEKLAADNRPEFDYSMENVGIRGNYDQDEGTTHAQQMVSTPIEYSDEEMLWNPDSKWATQFPATVEGVRNAMLHSGRWRMRKPAKR